MHTYMHTYIHTSIYTYTSIHPYIHTYLSFPTAGTRFWVTSNRNSQPCHHNSWSAPWDFSQGSQVGEIRQSETWKVRQGAGIGLVLQTLNNGSSWCIQPCIPGKEIEEGQEGPALWMAPKYSAVLVLDVRRRSTRRTKNTRNTKDVSTRSVSTASCHAS